MTNREAVSSTGNQHRRTAIRGARVAVDPRESVRASLELMGARIASIRCDPHFLLAASKNATEIDLSGFLILPGLINAHDHLEFALFPRIGNPPYQNYIEWGNDIHASLPEVIAEHRSVPKELRLWWGGIRNLLCGVTTVSHHNPFHAEFAREHFPVKVIRAYGWGHSLELGGDLRAARLATPDGYPFLVHACEGVDAQSRDELWGLDRLGLLDSFAILVHGLAIDAEGVAMMRERGASLIVCPSSNSFLFGRTPNMTLLSAIENLALGSDSPLTAEGDLLDEVRFAIRCCGIPTEVAYRMVTEAPAAILRMKNSEGTLRQAGVADLIAVRDTGEDVADRLETLSTVDIEFVMFGGQVQLASEGILERLPTWMKEGLEPLSIGGVVRWLRVPTRELLRKTEEVLGAGQVRLGGKQLRIPCMASAAGAS